MKQSFGVRPARSCLLSMHWIVANHKKEGAVSGSAAGKTRRPVDATTIELLNPSIYAIDEELGAGTALMPPRWMGTRAFCGGTLRVRFAALDVIQGGPPLPPSWPDDIHAKHLRALKITER